MQLRPTRAPAWFTRTLSLRRNARLKPKSTTRTATGINAARVVQKSMGMTGGSFNTREFFHGRTREVLRAIRWGFPIAVFVVPALLLAAGLWGGMPAAIPIAFAVQYAGLLAERWYFFAEARHPQNLYYQAVV